MIHQLEQRGSSWGGTSSSASGGPPQCSLLGPCVSVCLGALNSLASVSACARQLMLARGLPDFLVRVMRAADGEIEITTAAGRAAAEGPPAGAAAAELLAALQRQGAAINGSTQQLEQPAPASPVQHLSSIMRSPPPRQQQPAHCGSPKTPHSSPYAPAWRVTSNGGAFSEGGASAGGGGRFAGSRHTILGGAHDPESAAAIEQRVAELATRIRAATLADPRTQLPRHPLDAKLLGGRWAALSTTLGAAAGGRGATNIAVVSGCVLGTAREAAAARPGGGSFLSGCGGDLGGGRAGVAATPLNSPLQASLGLGARSSGGGAGAAASSSRALQRLMHEQAMAAGASLVTPFNSPARASCGGASGGGAGRYGVRPLSSGGGVAPLPLFLGEAADSMRSSGGGGGAGRVPGLSSAITGARQWGSAGDLVSPQKRATVHLANISSISTANLRGLGSSGGGGIGIAHGSSGGGLPHRDSLVCPSLLSQYGGVGLAAGPGSPVAHPAGQHEQRCGSPSSVPCAGCGQLMTSCCRCSASAGSPPEPSTFRPQPWQPAAAVRSASAAINRTSSGGVAVSAVEAAVAAGSISGSSTTSAPAYAAAATGDEEYPTIRVLAPMISSTSATPSAGWQLQQAASSNHRYGPQAQPGGAAAADAWDNGGAGGGDYELGDALDLQDLAARLEAADFDAVAGRGSGAAQAADRGGSFGSRRSGAGGGAVQVQEEEEEEESNAGSEMYPAVFI